MQVIRNLKDNKTRLVQIKLENGCTYTGDFKNGNFEGNGNLFCSDNE